MNKNIISFLFVTFLFGNCFAQYNFNGDVFHRIDMQASELTEVVDLIVNRYEPIFNLYSTTESVNRDRITQYLGDILQHKQINSQDCDPGTVWFINDDYLLSGEDIYLLRFWWDGLETNESYFASYLDLRTNDEVSAVLLNRPGVEIDNVFDPTFKLIVLNSRCANVQNGLFIIIVEKDINLHGMRPPNAGSGSGTASPLGDTENVDLDDIESLHFQITPNPARQSARINWTLLKEEKVQMTIYEAASGKSVQTIIDQQILTAGIHQQRIVLNHLSSGMYFVEIRTSEERQIKRLMVSH